MKYEGTYARIRKCSDGRFIVAMGFVRRNPDSKRTVFVSKGLWYVCIKHDEKHHGVLDFGDYESTNKFYQEILPHGKRDGKVIELIDVSRFPLEKLEGALIVGNHYAKSLMSGS